MKQILLESIELKNFMGIRHTKIDFSPKNTILVGANATGKTTINSAFTWLLFNKDSHDRKDFEIKTIDRNGKVINGLEHSVTAKLNIDNRTVSLSKTYKEIWRKKKGEPEKTFSGHETTYSIDDVPMLKKDYDSYLDNWISENDFKILTDPLYFSQQLHWKDARRILLTVTGDIAEEEVIKVKPELAKLDLEGKAIEDFRKSVAAKRKKLNDEISRIPTRIDEVEKSKRQDNFTEIGLELAECERELREIEAELEGEIGEAPEVTKKKETAKNLRKQIESEQLEIELTYTNKKFELKKKVHELTDKKFDAVRTTDKLDSEIQLITAEIKKLEDKAELLREQWNVENDREFTADIETTCPTCLQELPEETLHEKIQMMKDNFNIEKSENLLIIEAKGRDTVKIKDRLKKEREDKKKYFEEYREKAAVAISELEQAEIELNDFLKTPPDENKLNELEEILQRLQTEIAEIEAENEEKKIRNLKIERKAKLKFEIDNLKSILVYKNTNEEADKRIIELKQNEKELAQKIADIEKQEYLSDEFIKAKVGLLEQRINEKFQYVKFRLFETQVNGAIDEVCKALVKGVPFSDANRAGQVNAGIDIINTLSKSYGITAPIWIDNRESITELIDTESQVINLIVDENYKNLTVINPIVKFSKDQTLFEQE